MKWQPEGYQKRGMKFLLEHPGAALFLRPGLRKTSIVLGALTFLKKKRIMRKTLIVAPSRICYNVWPDEIEKWDDFNHLTCVILHGPHKDKMVDVKADIYLTTPDLLHWFFNEAKAHRKIKPDTLVIDESTKFKGWSSDRMANLKPHLHRFARRWIMSGGPTPNTYLDLFAQIFIVDLGATLGKFITHFRSLFFNPDGVYGWKLIEGMDKRIDERVKPHVFSISPSEHIKLPKRILNPVKVDLPDKARNAYDKMEEQLWTEVGRAKNKIHAVNSGVASMKCRQLAGGAVYKEKDVTKPEEKIKKGDYINVHSAKLEAVEELVEELNGSPVLILYNFKHELWRLYKLFGKNTPCLSDCTMTESKRIIKAWNNNEIPVLLGHPDSMGHGLNLQEGDAYNVIFYSLTWNYDSFDQTIKRLERSGSKHSKIIAHLIMARDTVDDIMLAVLNMKGNRQDKFLKAVETYKKRRKK